jgi:competence protein ComEA
VAIVLSLESWNRAEVSRELGQDQREGAPTDGSRGENVAAEVEGFHIEADSGEGGRNEVEEDPTPADAGEPSALTVFVHVAGQVVSPGLYELPMDARVYDAIEAAGGPTDSADTDAINLASPLIDGQQLLVPKPGELPPPMDTANGQALDGQLSQDSTAASVNPTGTGAASGGGRVNINTATAEQLDTLPGVGPAIAQRIIEFRETHGGFTTVTDLRSVSGIGPAMMSKLQDLVTVDGP